MSESMLDEKSIRRAEHREDMRITLADGQDWFLPRPVMKVGIRRGPDGRSERTESYSFGQDYIDKLQRYQEVGRSAPADDAPDADFDRYAEEIMIAKIDLVMDLLLMNYDLDPDQASDLLVFDMGDRASIESLNNAVGLAVSVRPKAITAGSSPA